jgi:hypothetical protein
MKTIVHYFSAIVAGLLLLAPLYGGLLQKRPAVGRSVVGTWKLISYEARNQAGEISYPMGPKASGLLIYDASGHMMIQSMRAERTNFKTDDRFGGTPEEAKAAFESSFAYYGTYRIDAARGSITHHIEGSSFPNWVNTQQDRFFTVTDDRLELRTSPTPLRGQVLVGTLTWMRVN